MTQGWYRFGGAALAYAMLAAAAGPVVAQEAGSEYAEVMAEVDRYSQYNAHLEQLLASQERDIASITEQLGGLDATAEQVEPLVQRMFAELEEFVANDLPFLPEERSRRIDTLRVLMEGDDSIAEKFRRVLEAYTIEIDYGRNMQAYPGELDGREVQFIHLGRISLMYRTTDGEETGYWDRNSKSWVVDSRYHRAVEEAIRMAGETLAPDVVELPVPTPESRS